ncbi:MAG: hypothetical protein KDK39_00965 [Leptospiraceae bacterium]|nr:hypothetical protein [Leptospiraceae bacterium]
MEDRDSRGRTETEQLQARINTLLLLSNIRDYCPAASMPLYEVETAYSIQLDQNMPHWFNLLPKSDYFIPYVFQVTESPGQDVDIYSQQCNTNEIRAFPSAGPGVSQNIYVRFNSSSGSTYDYTRFFLKCHQGCELPFEFTIAK